MGEIRIVGTGETWKSLSGLGCSKLTTSLVNDSFKFQTF